MAKNKKPAKKPAKKAAKKAAPKGALNAKLTAKPKAKIKTKISDKITDKKKNEKKANKKVVKKIALSSAKKSEKKSEKNPVKSSSKTSTPMANKTLDLSNFITPLDDRLIVQVSAAERKTPGGLYIPDTAQDASGNLKGVVLSVGRGRRDKKGRLHPVDVKKGDRVVFAEFSGNKINLLGQDLVILREADVMGIVTN